MIYHFIYFYDPRPRSRKLQYFNYLCVKSCYLTQNNPTIYLHYTEEPTDNIWWNKIKELVTLKKIENIPETVLKCNNQDVWRLEHRCDILRLFLLKEYGGVYADLDVFFYKPFFPKFSEYEFTMGKEVLDKWVNGLCNGVIISKPNARFLDIWYDSYLSEYDNMDWNKMSVRKPYELSKKYPELINVESEKTFHKYLWSCDMYGEQYQQVTDEGIYAKHMYASQIFDCLSRLTEDRLRVENSLFGRMCRSIDGLL